LFVLQTHTFHVNYFEHLIIFSHIELDFVVLVSFGAFKAAKWQLAPAKSLIIKEKNDLVNEMT